MARKENAHAAMRKPAAFVLAILALGLWGGMAMPSRAAAATLGLLPGIGSFAVGQTFTVSVVVATPDQAMNAVSGQLVFSASQLQVQALSKDSSIIKLWAQEPSFSNGGGTVDFEGVVLNPGYRGSTATVLRVTFKVKSTGMATVNFASGSVLANDGQGTNILTGTSGGRFTLAAGTIPSPAAPAPAPGTRPAEEKTPAPVIRSSTHPDQEAWSGSPVLTASWNLPTTVDAVRYGLMRGKENVPTEPKDLAGSIDYNLDILDDGTWYFGLQFHSPSGWGPTAFRKVRIDRTPPEPFKPAREDLNDPSNPLPLLAFSTLDSLSGVKEYHLKVGNSDWLEADALRGREGQYVLPLQAPGSHAVTVRAVDNAGNAQDAVLDIVVEPIPAPVIETYTRTISGTQEPFVASGKALAGTKILASLVNGDRTATFSTLAGANGKWSLAYSDILAPGSYTFEVRAQDSRGALSLPVASNDPLNVRSWSADAVGRIGQWTFVALAGIAALALIAGAIIYAWGRIALLRRRLASELVLMEHELDRDAARLARDARAHRRLTEDVQAIHDDIAAELEKIKKF